MVDTPTVNRRTALKGIGGLTILGAGGFALTGGAGATLTTSFSADPVTVTTDDGDVTEIHLNPKSRVEWDGFDVPVVKIRQLLEARLKDSDGNLLSPTDPTTTATQAGWWPIFRETHWLFEVSGWNEAGTTYPNPDFQYTSGGSDYGAKLASENGIPWYAETADAGKHGHFEGLLRKSGDPSNPNMHTDTPYTPTGPAVPTYVVHEDYSMPDYLGDYDDRYLTGVSIDGGQNYINGSYGTVGDTADIDNATDGSTLTTTAEIRLTTSLHTVWDFVENNPDGHAEDYLAPLVMGQSADVDHQFAQPEAIPYDELHAHAADHPAIDVAETAFAINAENEPSATGSSTTGNTGGS